MNVSGKILVVEPEKYLRDSLKNILSSSGYKVIDAPGAQRAQDVLETEPVALVISELELDDKSGMQLFDFIKSSFPNLDVILLADNMQLDMALQLVDRGVYDFISKPFHTYDIILAVKRAFEKRRLIIESKDFQHLLEKKIKEQTLSLRLRNQEKQQLIINTIKSLVQTLEAKDKYTEGHSRRVAENSLMIAQSLGMDYKEQEEVHLAGLLHDIGKIGIKESILNKQGQLTEAEYTLIKTHPLISQRILEPIPQFKRVVQIIRHHHEFYDGSGYPDGLRNSDIPLGARILTISDAYDAMTSDRSYRAALPETKALDILSRNSGSQFDPELVKVFFRAKGIKFAV